MVPGEYTTSCWVFLHLLDKYVKMRNIGSSTPQFSGFIQKSQQKSMNKKITTRPLGPLGYGGYGSIHLMTSHQVLTAFHRTFVARPSDQTFTEEEMTSTFLKSRLVTWEFEIVPDNNLEG